MTPQHHLPADIERTSISIITRELDELGLTPPPETAAVVKRVIHTTADFDYTTARTRKKDETGPSAQNVRTALHSILIIQETE